MRIALFAAILLIVVSVPAAYAATLQLVTENGNVFSIDFDEILSIWEGYNPSNQTLAIAILQQQIANLTAGIIPTTNSTEIDGIQDRIDELVNQLNTNSTATDVLIDSLQDRIDILTDRLNAAIINSTATDVEIDVLQNTIDTLNNELDELESTLEDKIEDIDGVGAGALGASGRVVTIPLQGLLVYGNHTSYDTSGIINPSTLFAKPPGLVGWATLIQDNDPYVEYDIPSFGDAYLFDSETQDLERVITGDSVYVTRYRTLSGPAQTTFDADGLVVSEGGLVLLELDNGRLGAGVTVDAVVPAGSGIKHVSSPNSLYHAGYGNGLFYVGSAHAAATRTIELYATAGWTSVRDHCRDNSYVVCLGSGTGINSYRHSAELYKTNAVPKPSTLDVYVNDVANSVQDNSVWVSGGYGQQGTTSIYNPWSKYVSVPVEPPRITSSYYGGGLYHITEIIGQQQSVSFDPRGAYTQTMRLAPSGTWRITDDNPWRNSVSITDNGQYTLLSKADNVYLIINTTGGEVKIQGDVVSAATGITNIRGLPADTPWSLNLGDTVIDAGMTDSSGNVMVPHVAKDGVTVPRHVNYTSAPGTLIQDFRTVYDTMTVTDSGVTNEIELTIALSSATSASEIVLIAPDGELYAVKRSGTSLNSPYYVTVPNVDINGVWTIGVKGGSGAITLHEWTLAFKTADSQLVTGVNGTGNQYAVTVDTSGSGTYRLGMADTHGIRDSSNNFLDDSLQTGPDETHDVGGGGGPNLNDPLHVYSIERHDPLSVLSTDSYPQFLVTFNKPVENVDVADFTGAYHTPSQITRTITTPLDVWYGESTIEVPQRGTRTASNTNSFVLDDATPTVTSNIAHTNSRLSSKEVASVSVTVDMNHTYGADVKIDLVAPDGTQETILNGGGGGGTYTGETFTNSNTTELDSFIGVSARGTWSLIVEDTYPSSDHGTLDGWELTLGYGDSTVTYVEHEPESSGTSVSLSSSRIVTNATLTLDATSVGSNANEWELSLTTPSGIDIELTDADITSLDYSGGVHTFHLGEIVGVFPGSGTWRLNAVDLKIDHDPTSPDTDEPEGTIDSWTLDLETLSKRTVREVVPHGSDDTEYLVEIHAGSRSNGYVIFLKGDTDISATGSGETYDTRNTVFAPDPHEHYDRSGSVSSTPHLRSITVANSTYNSVTFTVTFSEIVTGVDASDFVVYKDGTPYGPTIISNTDTPNVDTPTRLDAIGKIEEFMTVSGYDDDDSTVVELGINITHTAEEDLRFFLTAPSGVEKSVVFSASGEDLVQTSNEVDFGTASVNGEWILRVEDYRDHVPVQKRAFLNEWTLKFVYQDEPTYDELVVLASQLGTDRAFAPVPEGQHSLRLYSDTLGVNPMQSPGVLFDVHHDNVISFTPSDGDYSLFVANTYIRYPMTVAVNISDVRLSSQSDCSSALDLGIDRVYDAGDILMIPVLPGTTVLCMNIAGSNAVIHLGDVLAQSVVSSIPSAVSDGQRAISGAATFANRDGILTATVTAAMTGSISVERSLDYNDVYAHTSTLAFRESPSFSISSSYSSNLIPRLDSALENRWDAAGTSNARHFYSDRPTLTMNVYLNGELIETSTEFGPSSRPGSYRISNFAYYSMDQKISAQLGTIDLYEIIPVEVKRGDFVQVEITANDDMSFRLPPSALPRGFIYEYFGHYPSGCPQYGVGLRPSECYVDWDNRGIAYASLNPLYPDAKPVITSVESKKVEIIGGYVIFAGN